MSGNTNEWMVKVVEWDWNEETDEWTRVEKQVVGREVTGEWRRDERGEWQGWNQTHSWVRDANGQVVEGHW